jgi:hypothetical protein
VGVRVGEQAQRARSPTPKSYPIDYDISNIEILDVRPTLPLLNSTLIWNFFTQHTSALTAFTTCRCYRLNYSPSLLLTRLYPSHICGLFI